MFTARLVPWPPPPPVAYLAWYGKSLSKRTDERQPHLATTVPFRDCRDPKNAHTYRVHASLAARDSLARHPQPAKLFKVYSGGGDSPLIRGGSMHPATPFIYHGIHKTRIAGITAQWSLITTGLDFPSMRREFEVSAGRAALWMRGCWGQ
ncbi:hypothetical protein LX36DRAFT_454786 [Colletotrichum falcatum]|nr:hypothetical protein LX36DRAFT_454786 [Colletotrichum falcatum]